MLIFSGLCLVVASILFMTSQPVRSWASYRQNRQYILGFEPSLDPKPGTLVHLPQEDVDGNLLAKADKGKTLLVLMGQCGSCAEHKISLELIDKVQAAKALLVYTGTPTEVKGHARPKNKSIGIVCDEAADVTRQLNSEMATPRCAILDTAGRLMALQAPDEDTRAFLEKYGLL